VIVEPFPQPPRLIRTVLLRLQVLAHGDQHRVAELDHEDRLARPWLPDSCGNRLRQQLWLWCDDVVTWLNVTYAWRPGQLIPDCWPAHPHIAAELPALACQRVLAEAAFEPEPLEDWHRYTLPLFLDRLDTRLGPSGCRTGKHDDWPAAPRQHAAQSRDSVASRQELFYADTHLAAIVERQA
jgi:hypothetical protein